MSNVREPSTFSSNVSEAISRLRAVEDHNLAMRLQEQEFNEHYQYNRGQRRLISSDVKHSKNEQILEEREFAEARKRLNEKIVESDEALARRLQQEIDDEEAQKMISQARINEKLAQRLQLIDDEQNLNVAMANRLADDERIARELQKKLDETLQPVHSSAKPIDSHKKKFNFITPKLSILTTGRDRRSQSLHLSSNRATQSKVREWDNGVDVSTQNEVNAEMAKASNSGKVGVISATSSQDLSTISSTRTPLAVIATRNPPFNRNTSDQKLIGRSHGACSSLFDHLPANGVRESPDVTKFDASRTISLILSENSAGKRATTTPISSTSYANHSNLIQTPVSDISSVFTSNAANAQIIDLMQKETLNVCKINGTGNDSALSHVPILGNSLSQPINQKNTAATLLSMQPQSTDSLDLIDLSGDLSVTTDFHPSNPFLSDLGFQSEPGSHR